MRQLTRPPAQRQRGITLLESLVAIVVAALGVLGILGAQMRTLADTQTSVRRAQAVRLIEDLGERLKVSPNALANMDRYVSGWSPVLPTPRADPQCDRVACTGTQLAAHDIAEWKRSVQAWLPLGDANVFVAKSDLGTTSNRRQLGVMIRWRENEKTTDDNYPGPLNAATGGGDVSCPEGYACHLQYLPVSARCAPYQAAGSTRYFCPGS